jgi:hypothetical protein
MEESDPAKKVLRTKPRGNRDSRSGRLMLRWCDKLEEESHGMGAEFGELKYSQDRSGENSLRRPKTVKGS